MTAILSLLQAIPDAGTIRQGADWLQDGYTLAAAIAVTFGGVIYFLAKRLMSVSDAQNAERLSYLDELKKRKGVSDGE